MNFETRNFEPAPWAHLCVSSTVQQSVLSPEVSVLQQLVFHLDVSVQQQPVLCQKMAYSSLWCTWTVCLQKPALHRDVSVYKSFCVHLRCLSNIWSLCCTYACLSTRAFVCTWGVFRLYRACAALSLVRLYFVQHLEVSVFKSLCCICAFLSTRALFCICACLQSTRVLCCTWTCLPTRVQCRLYLEEHSLQHF